MSKDASFRQIDRMFAANKFNVVVLKYGKRMQELFRKPGGKSFRRWVNGCSNFLYSTLAFQGGKAFRKVLKDAIGDEPGVRELLESMNDDQLFDVMTNLGGHDFEVRNRDIDRFQYKII